jgi:hypothetical protein
VWKDIFILYTYQCAYLLSLVRYCMINLLILPIRSTLSRKPVYVIGGERCRWKFVDFQKTLRQRGLTRALTGAEDVSRCILLSWML